MFYFLCTTKQIIFDDLLQRKWLRGESNKIISLTLISPLNGNKTQTNQLPLIEGLQIIWVYFVSKTIVQKG